VGTVGDELHKLSVAMDFQGGSRWQIPLIDLGFGGWMFVGDVQNEKGPINIHPILERSFGQQIYPKYLAVIHQQETYDGYGSRPKVGIGDLHAFTYC
jgi:hypothetical protein